MSRNPLIFLLHQLAMKVTDTMNKRDKPCLDQGSASLDTAILYGRPPATTSPFTFLYQIFTRGLLISMVVCVCTSLLSSQQFVYFGPHQESRQSLHELNSLMPISSSRMETQTADRIVIACLVGPTHPSPGQPSRVAVAISWQHRR